MLNRLNGWQQLGVVLIVLWTLAVVMSGWAYLPRAQNVAHDPEFLNQLSSEAASILRGSGANLKTARGEPVWSDEPRIVRMPNGAQLKFPSIATDERIELVAGEYRALLDDEAAAQRAQYVILLLAIWLTPIFVLLAAGLAGNQVLSRAAFGNEQTKSRPGATLA
jgi:hypothetical protein